MPKRTEQPRKYVNVYFEEGALRKVDDFRFKHRFQSRTEALRWLVDWALAQKPTPEVLADKSKGKPSK